MYCNSISGYSRLLTREVPIGDVPVGGDNPIRVQSMTNTPTLDTRATVNQAIRMIETGCEYVRITVPGIKEAENLAFIKKELLKKGYHTPLIADIHFNPAVAEIAARLVEKVRINPGNYADKKQFHEIAFTDSEYTAELERIRERLHPLIRICKEYGTALRIGSNHGSLSDRILSRFGDTPEGMAESAMEFIRICEDLEFHNIVLSMKSSNVRVMVQATRLLVSKMQQGNTVYPLHLGVTEAGDAEEGRIKSAAGICTLLTDGIGDTIRVSLTEEPEKEIPVAKALVKYIEKFKNTPHFTKNEALPFNPFAYARRKTKPIVNIGGALPPVVISHTKKIPEGVHVFDNDSVNIVAAFRNFISQKDAEKDTSPVIIKRKYSGLGLPDFIITAAADCTPLFIDGLADGLCLQA
ncbi:MAG: (E)-4-hydroxy-3-methylbut-2-enyl-diphosphate synthase, partial [Lentimicrobiaceae bacterium]|nr:(E)-4-hydroxy-3-methylbut-2-enyl-diphosphate synthase [Lentimicrobiaceae bacterium]